MGTGGFLDSSLKKRVLVAVVFAPLIVWLFITRGLPLAVFLGCVTLLGQWELYGMIGPPLRASHRTVGYISGILIIASGYFSASIPVSAIIITALLVYFSIEIVSGKEQRLEIITLSLFATAYPPAFCVYLIKIGVATFPVFGDKAGYILLFLLLVVWVFDTASYFAGRSFGKHPFFPSVSPKKTVEGFIGGILFALIAGIAAGFFFGYGLFIHCSILSLLIALSGQAGDLAESIIKRDRGTKDSSGLLPGHGGILDRFDSLFFAGPFVYMYIVYIAPLL